MCLCHILYTLNAARLAYRRVIGHEMKCHGSGQEGSEKKLGTFTRLLIPTEDQKNGAEGGFLVFLVWTIYMRVVVVSVASWPCADLITDLAPFFWSSVGSKSLVNVPSFFSDPSCLDPWHFNS